MSKFSSYEEYCLAFKDTDKRIDAELVYYSRCWLNALAETMAKGNEYFGTNGFSFGEFFCEGKDLLSAIICDTQDAVSYISRNLRTKVVRENALLPIYQVKEINSAGMNWISRRPGKTIKEKLSGTSSVLGVQRRMSVDTGENRLFLEFVRRVFELIETKSSCLPAKLCCKEEAEFIETNTPFLYSEEASDIARWENLPPNNTLLSDKYYRRIWNGWTCLRQLDELIEKDSANIDSILTTIVFWKIFFVASGIYSFPQTPVLYDYESFTVRPISYSLHGISADKKQIILSYSDTAIKAFVDGNVLAVEIKDAGISVSQGKTTVLSERLAASSFDKTMHKIFKLFSFSGKPISRSNQKIKADCAIVSPFSDIPYGAADNGAAAPLGFRIASQTFETEENDNITLSLAESMVFCADNTKSIVSLLNCKNDVDAYNLFADISERINASSFCFLFPDSLNEFMLTPIRKAARVFYNKIEALPQSIGAVFGCEGTQWFSENYSEDTLLLVLDIVDTNLIITPIKGVVNNSLEAICPERSPIVWERFPTAAYSVYGISQLEKPRFENLPALVDLFPTKLSDSNRSIPLFFNGDWVTIGDVDDSGYALNIEKCLKQYIKTHSWVSNTDKIKVISLTNRLLPIDSKYSVLNIDAGVCVRGYQRCMQYTRKTGETLWKDHLPNLSIKQPLTKFDLVKNQTVIPLDDTEIEIRLNNNRFTLPAGQDRYSFELIQEEAQSNMQYRAVLEHSAFPLKEAVECQLIMRYKYGADNPYILTFCPIKKQGSGFTEVVAQWRKEATDYSYCDSVYPEFPVPVGIDTMRCYPPTTPGKPPSDLINWVVESFNPKPEYTYQMTGSERWGQDKKTGAEFFYAQVDMNGLQVAVQVYDNDHTIRYNASEIYFQAYLVRDTFYRARNVYTNLNYDQYTEFTFLNTRYCCKKRFTSASFGLGIILAGGRKIDNDGYPVELVRAVRDNIGHVWEAYRCLSQQAEEDKSINSIDIAKILTVLCLVHSEMGDDFYEFLINHINLYAKNNYMHLNPNIGYAIGPCQTENQKRLFERIVKIVRKQPSKGFNMLSRALWKNPDMIFNADADTLLACLKESLKPVAGLGNACKNNPEMIENYIHGFHITSCFEFILAMFRLRASDNPDIREALRCNSPIIMELREALYDIAESQNEFLFESIRKYTHVKLNFERNCNSDLPDLLYALMRYAAGSLEGDSIIISGISDED